MQCLPFFVNCCGYFIHNEGVDLIFLSIIINFQASFTIRRVIYNNTIVLSEISVIKIDT